MNGASGYGMVLAVVKNSQVEGETCDSVAAWALIVSKRRGVKSLKRRIEPNNAWPEM